MFIALQILTVMVVAVAMALSLAHALELPGKMRLDKEKYYAVQRIYYPGFTIGGICEPGGLILTIILLLVTPSGSLGFWLTLVALLGLLGMQGVYWFVTHPVNKVWLGSEKLSGAGASFFAIGGEKSRFQTSDASADWTKLRDRWEFSHVARAALSLVSLGALTIAIAYDR
jgi:Domain of unknown function (DUF1772)